MRLQTGLLTAAAIILSLPSLGEEPRSDFTIYITSIEHREHNSDRPYKVELKTSGSPPIRYYTISCQNGAADLQVGHTYQATEGTWNGVKTLWISHHIERDPTVVALICDVESEKTSAKKPK